MKKLALLATLSALAFGWQTSLNEQQQALNQQYQYQMNLLKKLEKQEYKNATDNIFSTNSEVYGPIRTQEQASQVALQIIKNKNVGLDITDPFDKLHAIQAEINYLQQMYDLQNAKLAERRKLLDIKNKQLMDKIEQESKENSFKLFSDYADRQATEHNTKQLYHKR